MFINNSTLINNSAPAGEAIFNFPAEGGDPDPDFHLTNSLLASSNGGILCDGAGITQSNINNLIEDGSCSPDFMADPILADLGDYGGNTETIAFYQNSPAINYRKTAV